jgi:hypothetical protein
VLTRRIYFAEKVSDESIAATLNHYMTINENAAVIEELQAGAQAVVGLVNMPRVIEFPCFRDMDPLDDELSNPQIAASIIGKVIKALSLAFARCLEECQAKYPIDANFKDSLGLTISNRKIQPTDFNTEPLASKFLSIEALKSLASALTVKHRASDGSSEEAQLDIQQYYFLLRKFGSSVEVQEVLLHHSSSSPSTSLDSLTSRGLFYFMSSPLVSATMSLDMQLSSIDPDHPVSEGSSLEAIYQHLTRAQRRLTRAQMLRSDGDSQLAFRILDRIFDAAYDSEDEEDEDEHRETSLSPSPAQELPAQLLASIYAERASCKLDWMKGGLADDSEARSFLIDALVDSNLALSADDCCVEAYTVRSKILSALSSMTDDDEQIEDQNVSASSALAFDPKEVAIRIIDSRGRKVDFSKDVLLHAGAKDVLTAFVLGGSSDITLASFAEDSVREACRNRAKAIYADRIKELQGSSDGLAPKEASARLSMPWTPPKTWMVKSFFSAYELLSDAFAVLPLPLQSDRKPGAMHVVGSLSSGDIDDVDKPVDPYLRPPDHLLDSLSEEKGSKCQADALMRAYDSYGYRLLQRLVDLFDSLLEEEPPAVSSLADDSSAISTNADGSSSTSAWFSSKEGLLVEESMSAEEIQRIMQSLSSMSLVDLGVAALDDYHSEDLVPRDERSSNSNPVAEALQLLSNEEAMKATGLIIAEVNGSFRLQCLPAARTRHAARSDGDDESADEEEDWEDCDEEETESDQEHPTTKQAEDEDAAEERLISSALRSRLLNICSAIAYLCGDAAVAVLCLRTGSFISFFYLS